MANLFVHTWLYKCLNVCICSCNSYCVAMYAIAVPEQELILEHVPFTRTVPSLQKQPLIQGDCSLQLLTPVMSLQDIFLLHS